MRYDDYESNIGGFIEGEIGGYSTVSSQRVSASTSMTRYELTLLHKIPKLIHEPRGYPLLSIYLGRIRENSQSWKYGNTALSHRGLRGTWANGIMSQG